MPSETTSRPSAARGCAQPGVELAGHRVLVAEERVERPRADDGAQRQLRLAVQGLAVVLDRGHGPERVGHPVGHDRVHAQRDLVGGHDLLAGDVHDLLAQVHRHDLRARDALPERVGTRGERRLVAAVAEEEAHVARLDRDRLEQGRGARQRQDGRELLVLEERARARRSRRRARRAAPSRARRRPACSTSSRRPSAQTIARWWVLRSTTRTSWPRRPDLHHELEVRVHEPAVADRHDLDLQAEQRVEHPVDARLQHALERAVLEDERALVLEDLDTTQDHDDETSLSHDSNRRR